MCLPVTVRYRWMIRTGAYNIHADASVLLTLLRFRTVGYSR
jgi:hypothetical protein